MKEHKNNVQVAIEERFRRLVEKSESSPELKKQVMTTIDRIENIAIVLDIFSIKMVKTQSFIMSGLIGDLTEGGNQSSTPHEEK